MPLLNQSQNFERYFLTSSPASIAAYQSAIATIQDLLINNFANQAQPYSGKTPKALAASLITKNVGSFIKQEPQQIQNQLKELLNNSVIVTNPTCIAHLHCPPLIPALAAEMLIAATNQSMDSWDQSPIATILEQQLTDWLCALFGYDIAADGVFTSGGTQSNFMGLLLARDNYAKTYLNWSIQQQGLPPEAQRFRILCSEVAHFTVRQSAALLGLGEQAVVPIETDRNFCLSATRLEQKITELQHQKLLPIAIVGTAGTTDFGSIDPLLKLASSAHKHGLWLHVDAAYGGALRLSAAHAHKLNGIELADSIAVDFHKLFYQPISCGAFLLKNKANFNLIKLHADYLNPESNEAQGIPDLVTKSIQTTRRFDALKLWLSLQTLGTETFAEIINTTINLATENAKMIAADSQFELATAPAINAVVFRYCPSLSREDCLNRINSQIPKILIYAGKAVIAKTQIKKQVYLKFTLLNPHTTLSDLSQLLNEIKHLGQQLTQSHAIN
jgi:L-2,4-diaminobutyrate decarboxylase